MGEVKKLGDAEVRARLSSVRGWSLDQGKLYRELNVPDFLQAFAFR